MTLLDKKIGTRTFRESIKQNTKMYFEQITFHTDLLKK